MKRRRFCSGHVRVLIAVFPLTAMILVLLSAATGCPPTNKPRCTPVVDLAVGSSDNLDSYELIEISGEILLYFDVLEGDGAQDPTVVIGGEAVPQLVAPASIVLTEKDLYAADPYSNRVMIWRNYLGLSAKGPEALTPDVELTIGMASPSKIIVEENRLIVMNSGEFIMDGNVAIYSDATGLTEDVEPDAVVPFCMPYAIEYEANHLYIAGIPLFDIWEDLRQDEMTGWDVVEVYDSVSSLLVTPPDGPDAVLAGPSWAGLDQYSFGGVYPQELKVANNKLFVATGVNFLFVFGGADALTDEQIPDAILSESSGALNAPYAMECVGSRLFVGNLNLSTYGKSEKINNVGLVGFDSAASLVTGQAPAVVFDTSNAQIAGVMDLAAENKYLFVAASNAPSFAYMSSYLVGDVHIFSNADRLKSGRQADIVLPGMKDFSVPLAIDTNRRVTSNN